MPLSEGQQRQAEQLSNQERALKAQSDQLAGLSQQQAEVTHALADMVAQLRMTNMQLSTFKL